MDTKERILTLLQFLRDNTDDETALSAVDIRQLFRDRGEGVSAPTLRDDIASLRRCGYEIASEERSGIGTYYRLLDREWSQPELQILVDAVSAGQFLTKKKTDGLIGKIRRMAGPSEREDLRPGILTEGQLKAPNEQILYIIQKIKEAMKAGCRISFRHYQYTPDLERVPKHEGYRYEVSPYAMIWKKDRYYLVGWSEKHHGVARFRIDRMELARLLKKEMRPIPPDLHLEDHSDKIFSMFEGPEETVTLRFRPELMNQVTDQFGTAIKITKLNMKTLDVTVQVHLSPTFYAWLFQYAGEMTVVAPEAVCQEYAGRLQTAIDDALGN